MISDVLAAEPCTSTSHVKQPAGSGSSSAYWTGERGLASCGRGTLSCRTSPPAADWVFPSAASCTSQCRPKQSIRCRGRGKDGAAANNGARSSSGAANGGRVRNMRRFITGYCSISQVKPCRDPQPRLAVPGTTDKLGWHKRGEPTEWRSRGWEQRWSGRRDSNPRHQPWQGCTLPTE